MGNLATDCYHEQLKRTSAFDIYRGIAKNAYTVDKGTVECQDQ
jgi:hypothetical protein